MRKLLTIRDRFIFIGIIIFITLIGINGFLLITVERMAALPLEIIDHPLQVSNAASYANVEMLRMQKDLEQILLVEQDFEVNILVDRIRVAEGRVYAALDIIAYDILGDEGRELQKETRDIFEAWKPIRSSIIESVFLDDREQALLIIRGQGTEHAEILERKLVELNQYARVKATEFQDEVIVLEGELRQTVVTGMMISVLIVALSIAWISMNVLNSIKSLGIQLNDIINSNELKQVHLDGSDEMVHLSGIFNELVRSLDDQLWIREGNRRLYNMLNSSRAYKDVLKDFLIELVDYGDFLSVAYYHVHDDYLQIDGFVNRMSFMDTQYTFGVGIVGEVADMQTVKTFDYNDYAGQVDKNLPFRKVMFMPVVNDLNTFGVLVLVLKSELKNKLETYVTIGLKDLVSYLINQEQKIRIDKLLDQYVQTNEELTHRQKELEDSNVYRSQFFANVSHELKTPLNSIIILSSLLSEKDINEIKTEDVEKIQVISKAANELLGIIDDILDLSKVESGKVEITESLFTVEQLIVKLDTMYRPILVEKGLDYEFDYGLDQALYGDVDKIYHILSNLMSNAIKFTKAGRVSVRVDILENVEYPIRITVTDTGIGIEQDKIQVIFDEFVQSDGSIVRHYGGTGLGLAICNNYAHLLGGHIEVESEYGAGSTFTLELPARYVVQDYEVNVSRTTALDTQVTRVVELNPLLKHSKIIVCDDEAFNVFALSTMLEEVGLEPIEALSAKELYDAYGQSEVDMILIDYMMPEVDGLTALTQLKKRADWKEVPIAVITAAELNASEMAMIEMEAYTLIKKPITPNALIELINSSLQ